ncbi:MAG: NIPSNAP family protein [Rhizobiales bacterium]|nr:NIPSNAP family protein [Hyphomicrobiales bacterium]
MLYYEIATLKTVIFGAAKAAAGLEAWLKASEARGKLLGAWFNDIGGLNEVYILRSFDTLDAMMAERDRALLSGNPMGCMEFLINLTFDSYKIFDFLPEVQPGSFGPVYEFRTYKTTLNGIAQTQNIWRDAMPKRLEYSPLTIAMYGLDGAPRMTHIWPYASIEERSKIRAQAVADGIWPPKGGPDWLTPDMTSAIAMPMAFSPLK